MDSRPTLPGVKPTLREFTVADHPAALGLWQQTEGMGLSAADEPEAIARFLERNPGLSGVAETEGRLVGAVLCGHDGRRGFLYHLAVARECRGTGLGRRLVEHCLAGLKAQGIARCHVVVLPENATGREFWKHLGYYARPELLICSRDLTEDGAGAARPHERP